VTWDNPRRMRERMSLVDAAWLRMDRPENTADVVALLGMQELPSRDVLLRILEERLLPYRRLRKRTAVGVFGASWQDQPNFVLAHHLESVRLTERGPALEELVGRIASEPLDPSRPPWCLYAVELPGAGALVAKLSHCLADGFALIGLMLSLTDGARDRSLRQAFPVSRSPLLGKAPALETLARPGRLLDLGANTAALCGAAARMIALPADPVTSLSRPLCGRRRVAWSAGFSLASLRALARVEKVTVNDLLLAALAGALGEQLALASGSARVESLRALVPVNLRKSLAEPDADPLGNEFGLVFLDLPVAERSRRHRLALIHARTTALKAGSDGIASFLLLTALGLLPVGTPSVFRFFSRKASLVVTNVPGPSEHLFLAGKRIDHVMFWVPHPATLGLGVSLLSYAGEVRVGVRADVAVVPDPGGLVRHFEAELAAFGAPRPERGGESPSLTERPGSEPRA